MAKSTSAEELRDRMLADSGFMEKVRKGVDAMKEGATTSWEDVKREVGIPDGDWPICFHCDGTLGDGG